MKVNKFKSTVSLENKMSFQKTEKLTEKFSFIGIPEHFNLELSYKVGCFCAWDSVNDHKFQWQKQPPEVFYKERCIAIFTEKHQCWSLF